jgi:internalin A
MEKFDLSYRITDNPKAASLVVERLPWESPSYQQTWAEGLLTPGAREIRLRYDLDTIPPGVPTWFIAREHRFSMDVHWRTGALLRNNTDPRVLGLIRTERQERTVELAVRGPVPQLFFGVLQDGFESTLSRYKGIGITRLVPCSCGHGDGTDADQPCQHLYLYDPLLRRLERQIAEVECELSFAKVNVADLLFGIAPTTTDDVVRRLDKLDRQVSDFRAETAWANRAFLKELRQAQARAEAICPTVFTLTTGHHRVPRPGYRQLKLRLYCEQPGEFHALPGDPYSFEEASDWLRAVGPYLSTVLNVLKYAAPLAGPVLGLTSEYLSKVLANETTLMAALVAEIPDHLAFGSRPPAGLITRVSTDAGYRELYGLLDTLDPGHRWAGLSRVATPEGIILWLCQDHVKLYGQ